MPMVIHYGYATFYPAFPPTSSIVASPTVIPVAIELILPKGAENWSASGNSPREAGPLNRAPFLKGVF